MNEQEETTESREDVTYTPDFCNFVWEIVDGIDKGEIRTTYQGKDTTEEMTILDLGIQFAIGSMMTESGRDTFTDDEICEGLVKYCGNVFSEDFFRTIRTTVGKLLPWYEKIKTMDGASQSISKFIVLHGGG